MRRINWHPSVVIWGGNNEVETAMDGWFPESRQNPQLYVADYVKLFLDTVHKAVAEVDPDFPFVDSSPSNGLLSTEPYVKRYVIAHAEKCLPSTSSVPAEFWPCF